MHARPTLITLLVLALLTLTAGCTSTGSRADGLSAQKALQQARDTARRAPQTLPLPEDALLVMRLQPERLDEAAARLTGRTSSPEPGEPKSDGNSLTRGAPPTHLASAFVVDLLNGHLSPTRRSDAPEQKDKASDETSEQSHFEHLDRTSSLYVAPRAAQFQPLLPRIRLGMVPPSRTWMGLSDRLRIRLLLPADDPAALADELQGHCADTPCPTLQNATPTDRWLSVDLRVPFEEDGDEGADQEADDDHRDEDDESDQRADLLREPLEPAPATPSSPYFQRVTPATVAFFDPTAAVTLHTRASGWWRSLVIWMFLRGTPDRLDWERSHRHARSDVERLFSRLHRLSQLVAGGATRAREYEDATLRLAVTPTASTPAGSTGMLAELVRTPTDRGRRVLDALSADPVSLPDTGMTDPMLEFDWSGDARAAMEAGESVEWLEKLHAISKGWERRQEYRNVDEWAPFAGPLFYPTAFATGFSTLSLDRYASPKDAFRRLDDLRAARIALDVDASREDGPGVNLRVAAALRVRRGSNIDATLQTLGDLVDKEMGLPTELQLEPAGDDVLLRFTIGLDAEQRRAAFGEAAEVAPGWRLRLHPAPLGREFGDVDPLDAIDTHRFHDDTLVLSNQPRVGSGTEEAGFSTRTRLWLGAGPPPPASPLAPDTTLQTLDGPPECLQKAASAAHDLGPVVLRAPTTDPEQLRRTLEAFEALSKTCDGDARQTLDWMAGLYTHYYGRLLATRLLWPEAVKAQSRACELGIEKACRALQTARRRAERHRLPRIGGLPHRMSKFSWPPLEVEADSVRFGRQGMTFSPGELGDGLARLVEDREIVHYVRPAFVVGQTAVSLAPHRDVSMSRLQDLLEAIRRTNQTSDASVPEGAVWLSIHPDDPLLVYHFTPLLYAEPKPKTFDGQTPLKLELGPEGVRVSHNDEMLPPADGCPDDGPTICDGPETLRPRLTAFKKDHPKLTHAVLRVEPSVDYDRFVRTLEAVTRDNSNQKLFPNLHLWMGEGS